ncbi:MAG: hypothetical protein EXR69_00870 [Myxococcales bacterium]|nr:hypothetical protein [Myxococcales bacterium]
MRRFVAPALAGALAVSACAPPEACDFPTEASAAGGVITEADACGYWSLAVGGHLYLDLHVSRELPDCALSLGDGVEVPNDPIYSALTTDSSKYTYDFVGQTAIEETSVDIACDEGTEWHALIRVE